jgi:hypothetical protein
VRRVPVNKPAPTFVTWAILACLIAWQIEGPPPDDFLC